MDDRRAKNISMDERRLKILGMDNFDWRIHTDERMQEFERRLNRQDDVQLAHGAKLELNTELTKKTYEATQDIVNLYTSAQTTTKLLARFGNFIAATVRKWWPVWTAIAAVWAWYHKGDGK